MTQTPPVGGVPGIPFDWLRFIDNDLMPLAVVIVVGIGVILTLRVIMRSPVGEAWAERIRRKTRERFGEPGALSGEQAAVQIEAMQDQLGRLESHLSEITERLDFTERVLTKAKE